VGCHNFEIRVVLDEKLSELVCSAEFQVVTGSSQYEPVSEASLRNTSLELNGQHASTNWEAYYNEIRRLAIETTSTSTLFSYSRKASEALAGVLSDCVRRQGLHVYVIYGENPSAFTIAFRYVPGAPVPPRISRIAVAPESAARCSLSKMPFSATGSTPITCTRTVKTDAKPGDALMEAVTIAVTSDHVIVDTNGVYSLGPVLRPVLQTVTAPAVPTATYINFDDPDCTTYNSEPATGTGSFNKPIKYKNDVPKLIRLLTPST
jgi:hypothetical protein